MALEINFITQKCHFEPEIFHLSIMILDHYLATQTELKMFNYRAYAVAFILIAQKVERPSLRKKFEGLAPYKCYHSILNRELKRAEFDIL